MSLACCYHGSPITGIHTLAPPPGGPLYLTNNRAYALFYIRDMEINWVSCGVREGVVVYDEQFPGQLRALYAGRGGWLYACENDGFKPGSSPWIVLADRAVPVAAAAFIPDAYEAILREIKAGTVRVDSCESKTPRRRQEFNAHMAQSILEERWLGANTPRARFVERYFPEAWEMARQLSTGHMGGVP